MIASLISKLFTFILSVISSFISIVLWPLDRLVNSLIPDLSGYVSQIESFMQTYIPGLSYFLSWIGPVTLSVIRLELALVSVFFTIYASYLIIQVSMYLITKFKNLFN